MNRTWIGLAIWAAAAPLVRAETWADWLFPPAPMPLAAEYRPAWPEAASRQGSSTRGEEWLGPNRGYDGDLVFTLTPGAAAPAGPLTVRFWFTAVHPDDMNWPEQERYPEDFVPQVRPQAVPRRAAAEETRTVPAEFPLRVPVVLPRACQSPAAWRTRRSPALFARYEVRDAAGHPLGRGLLPARRLSELKRNLVGEAEDDEALKQVVQRSGTIDRVSGLPDEMEAYRQVRGIWFTESLWAGMAGREALLRRLLLSGVRLSGETALVERIQATLGTGQDGRAVAESARPAALASTRDFSLKNPDLGVQVELKRGRERRRLEPSLFENEANLFAADRRAYLSFTLAGLLVFAGGVAVILGVVFIRHKGERRVAVWWRLPAWTLLSTVALWAGGALGLDRRPRADITEYRLALAGWPEMHCRAVAAAMTFRPGPVDWRLPAGAVAQSQRSVQLDGWWARQDAWISAEGLRLRLPRRLSGTTVDLEAGWFEPASFPVQLETGRRRIPAAGWWPKKTWMVSMCWRTAIGMISGR
jgi:hypothetical protein